MPHLVPTHTKLEFSSQKSVITSPAVIHFLLLNISAPADIRLATLPEYKEGPPTGITDFRKGLNEVHHLLCIFICSPPPPPPSFSPSLHFPSIPGFIDLSLTASITICTICYKPLSHSAHYPPPPPIFTSRFAFLRVLGRPSRIQTISALPVSRLLCQRFERVNLFAFVCNLLLAAQKNEHECKCEHEYHHTHVHTYLT